MSLESQQHKLIEHLRQHGIYDERVLQVMDAVPRWRFVPSEQLRAAADDRALPIAAGQTISQPFIVALMTQALRLTGHDHVLEIGTGSGYQAAILARLSRDVVSIERIPELSLTASQVLRQLGITNVDCLIGDGSVGCPERAPFDRIVVTAGAPKVPPQLCEQLTIGGRLVIPVGTVEPISLQVITRTVDGLITEDLSPCSFVPLIGSAGWPEEVPE
ncbi:MAG: protein-L-isoaspartate(D-aspartate) O-methyltransferase [Planctomycetes bacterium]|nr:protein-L-isoaspartate(D-aspartate) O-methyltransferase [Planctomycetota bacterium]